MRKAIYAVLLATLAGPAWAQTPIQTADPFKRGLTQADFPRLKQIEPNVYTYEALRPSEPDGFKTTVDLIVVTEGGVVVADGQGNEQAGRDLVAAISRITTQPIKYVVICSEHGDHTGGNAAFKAAFPDVVFISSPASQKALAKNPNPPTETVADKRTITMSSISVAPIPVATSRCICPQPKCCSSARPMSITCSRPCAPLIPANGRRHWRKPKRSTPPGISPGTASSTTQQR